MPQIKDVFNIDQTVFEHGNKILLLGGVGSGKSTWVTDVLATKGSVLFITSRKAKVIEDAQCSCFSEVFKWYTNGNQTLITNAKLSKLVERISDDYSRDLDDFIDHFDYIVIDEVHSLATDSAYAESCSGVLSFIEYVADKGKIIACMTGTPEPIQKYFDDNGWYTADYLNICDYVHPKQIALLQEKNTITYIKNHYNVNKIIYFANRTDSIAKLCKELLDKKIVTAPEIAITVSKSREEEYFNTLQTTLNSPVDVDAIKISSETTYKNILSTKYLPNECKILFSTSVLKEGINIENKDIVMFCENHVLSNLIQFFGRARKGDTKVFIIEESADHPIKHNELLYNYAVTSEAEAANTFYKKSINCESNPFSLKERIDLTKHVTKNPYIYYDYIKQEYRIFHMKYEEELRLQNNNFWQQKILTHCKKYDIEHLWFKNEEMYVEILIDLAQKKTRFYEEQQIKILQNLLYSTYKIKYVQPSKINEKLEGNNAPIRIHSSKGTSGNERNKTVWQVLFTEEFKVIEAMEKEKKSKKSKKIKNTTK